MPDFNVKIKWEFGSALFGPMVRWYAPSDVYDVTKKGTRLRVDGTLRGAEEPPEDGKAPIFPKWKRGDFSLLFDGDGDGDGGGGGGGGDATTAGRLFFVDHVKREAIDATDEDEDEATSEEYLKRVDELAARMIREGAVKHEARADDVKFRPAKSLFSRGGIKRDTVDGWKTQVWECVGKIQKKVVHRGGSFKTDGSFEQYLASAREGTAVAETEFDEYYDDGGDDDGDGGEPFDEDAALRAWNDAVREAEEGGAGPPVIRAEEEEEEEEEEEPPPPPLRKKPAAAAKAKPTPPPTDARSRDLEDTKPRKVSAKCWLAESFPVTIADVLPILDVVSVVNKPLKKAREMATVFAAEKEHLFPVKMLAPVMMSVYAVIKFKAFTTLRPDHECEEEELDAIESQRPPDACHVRRFEIPAGYALKVRSIHWFPYDRVRDVNADP